jgi:hypothetical protein
MSLTIVFIVLSIFFYLLWAIPYLYHIFHGKVVPHPFSWTVWAILSAVNTLGLIQNIGISYISISPIVSTWVLCFWAIIWWTLIKKIQITYFDYICLLLALWVIGIAYFFWLSQAIIPSVFVDLLLLAPTVKKFWKTPRSEDISWWLGAAISRFFLLLSLGAGALSFSNFWWWYAVVINLLVSVVLFYRTQYTEKLFYRIRKIAGFFALKKKLW